MASIDAISPLSSNPPFLANGRIASPRQTMRPTLSVRPVRDADFPAWLALWDAYNAFHGRRGATALDRLVTETTWQRFIDPAEPMFALIAEDIGLGLLLGFAHYHYHRCTTRIEPTCHLQDLFTRPDVRGRGVGRSLVEAVYREATDSGVKRVYWQSHAPDVPGRLLYNKVARNYGFIVDTNAA